MISSSHIQKFIIVILSLMLYGCPDSEEPGPEVYVYESVRSHCDPLILPVKSGETVTITTSDSVITNINGGVEDCDFWTDANGIPDCHYVDDREELHGLPFMALIGKFYDQYFLVGTNFQGTFTADGDLELSVNDWGGCGEDSDNVGQFVISVLYE